MSRAGMNRWNAKRDANEREIVDALKAVGALVQRHDSFDLLVLHKPSQTLTMIDVKTPGGKLTAKQQDMIDDGWPLRIVESVELALQICCGISWATYEKDGRRDAP